MAKKTASTALTKYDEKLAALAKQATAVQSSVGSGGNFLSIRGGQLTYQGTKIENNTMRVIILDAILENQWYNTPFDSDNPTSPACYAFGREANQMVPHEKATEKQNADCHSCPQMQFGSADRGKGKACKACQRLSLITEGDLENIEAAQFAYLKLPFYSTLEYAKYVRSLIAARADRPLPPFAYITEITVVNDPKAQFRVTFKMVSCIFDDQPDAIELLINANSRAAEEIEFPYPELQEEVEPARPARKSNGRTPAAPKPAARVAMPAPPPRVGAKPAVKPPKF